jgi:hypothetical protein
LPAYNISINQGFNPQYNTLFFLALCGDAAILISLQQHVKISGAYGTYLSGRNSFVLAL